MQTRRKNCYRRYLAAILLSIACTSGATAQTGIDTGLANAMQASIENMLTLYKVKGISAAAYIPGKGMWKGVSGVSYDPEPMDTNMLLSIGSATKTFVAAEIFKLVEAGQINLNDTIGALLPPMTNVNPAITVSQLLGHTSGMGEYLNSSWQTAMNADLSARWYFPAALSAFSVPAAGVPGSPFKYCNSNYNLLGMIIEAKKGDSLHRILRHDFLQPRNLDNMYMEMFEPYANPIPHNWATATLNPALAVDASGTPHEALWTSTEPAGGYFSDAASLAKWGYDLYSGKVLSAASLSQMLTFNAVSSSYFNGYGLGSMRFTANGRTYHGHAGNYFGYAASMLYYPEDSICVAVLINQDCIATYEARTLMNVLINKIASGINEHPQKGNITVSPNPANTELNISIPGNTNNIQISVTDITGKEVYKANSHRNTHHINTTDLDSGEYVINIIGDDHAATKQVIIKH